MFDWLAGVVAEPLLLSIMVVSVLACSLAMFTLIYRLEKRAKNSKRFISGSNRA